MTAMHLFYVASLAAMLLFFAAGAATMALRRRGDEPAGGRRVAAAEAAHPAITANVATVRVNDQVQADKLDALRLELANAEATVLEQRLVIDDQATLVKRGSQAIEHEVKAATEHLELRSVAEERAEHLASQLDHARNEAVATGRDVDNLQARLREAEQQLAERSQAVRDFSTQNEQLKGRVRDADGIRAEYVRLRTSAIESDFLKGEVARLEAELRAMKINALGAQPRRPARGSVRPVGAANRSIGESLSTVLDRFADAGTRSIAIADTLGFPLASSGDDGLALAAYASLLVQAASRSTEFLPVGAPVAIEMVHENGTRVSVWTFNVEHDRLLLVNLAVTPADASRVESALADLTAILAPTQMATGSDTAR